jgi:type II secretory pathway pseudopilin PulG
MKKAQREGGFNFKAGLIVIVLILILAPIGIALFQYISNASSGPPDAKDAPWMITTSSRLYLAQVITIKDVKGNIVVNAADITSTYTLKDGQYLRLTNWCDSNSANKFHFHKGTLDITTGAYGSVTITLRQTEKK